MTGLVCPRHRGFIAKTGKALSNWDKLVTLPTTVVQVGHKLFNKKICANSSILVKKKKKILDFKEYFNVI